MGVFTKRCPPETTDPRVCEDTVQTTVILYSGSKLGRKVRSGGRGRDTCRRDAGPETRPVSTTDRTSTGARTWTERESSRTDGAGRSDSGPLRGSDHAPSVWPRPSWAYTLVGGRRQGSCAKRDPQRTEGGRREFGPFVGKEAEGVVCVGVGTHRPLGRPPDQRGDPGGPPPSALPTRNRTRFDSPPDCGTESGRPHVLTAHRTDPVG